MWSYLRGKDGLFTGCTLRSQDPERERERETVWRGLKWLNYTNLKSRKVPVNIWCPPPTPPASSISFFSLFFFPPFSFPRLYRDWIQDPDSTQEMPDLQMCWLFLTHVTGERRRKTQSRMDPLFPCTWPAPGCLGHQQSGGWAWLWPKVKAILHRTHSKVCLIESA